MAVCRPLLLRSVKAYAPLRARLGNTDLLLGLSIGVV